MCSALPHFFPAWAVLLAQYGFSFLKKPALTQNTNKNKLLLRIFLNFKGQMSLLPYSLVVSGIADVYQTYVFESFQTESDSNENPEFVASGQVVTHGLSSIVQRLSSRIDRLGFSTCVPMGRLPSLIKINTVFTLSDAEKIS